MAESTPGRRPRLRMQLGKRLPKISGSSAALWLFACLLIAGLLIPFAIRREIWIRAEAVLAAWWLIWTIVLANLLHRELRVSDDHSMGRPRTWGAEHVAKEIPDGLLNSGCLIPVEGEGCMVLLGIVAAIAAVWFVIELAIPALTFVLYVVIRGMLAKVANDPHACGGNWPRSITWGGFWATIYMAPLGAAVWAIHWAAGNVIR